jgi:hypothetical protein
MSKENKMKKLSIDGHLWGGYRGDKNIVWQADNTSKTGGIEFATVCKCGTWYGWTTDLYQIKELQKKMGIEGCSHCRKKKKK